MDSYEGKRLEPLTLHKYSYAQNCPSNRLDPSGYASNTYYGALVHANVGVHFIAEGQAINHIRSADKAFHHMFEDFLEDVEDLTDLEDDGFHALWRPDLIDHTTDEIWEIKPLSRGKGLQRALRQIQRYQFNAMLLGKVWVPGLTYVPPPTVDLDAHFEAEVWSPVPGVILYEIYRKRQQPQPIPVPVRVPVTADELERRRVDPTNDLIVGPYATAMIKGTPLAIAGAGALVLSAVVIRTFGFGF